MYDSDVQSKYILYTRVYYYNITHGILGRHIVCVLTRIKIHISH